MNKPRIYHRGDRWYCTGVVLCRKLTGSGLSVCAAGAEWLSLRDWLMRKEARFR